MLVNACYRFKLKQKTVAEILGVSLTVINLKKRKLEVLNKGVTDPKDLKLYRHPGRSGRANYMDDLAYWGLADKLWSSRAQRDCVTKNFPTMMEGIIHGALCRRDRQPLKPGVVPSDRWIRRLMGGIWDPGWDPDHSCHGITKSLIHSFSTKTKKNRHKIRS